MDESLRRESDRLRRSWDRHPAEFLDEYLVSDVEDPRINMQSILTRGLVADTLFPGEFSALINDEWRFGLCMSWILTELRRGRARGELFGLVEGERAEACPAFVLETRRYLQGDSCPVHDYLTAALVEEPEEGLRLPSSALDVFEPVWAAELASREARTISVLEPACGSANDYRCLAAYGFAPFISYSGFDISEKNVANARRRFPIVDFRVGNVFEIDAGEDAYDHAFAHDLFEHLSPEGLAVALGEVLRVTRTQAWLSLFSLDTIPEHEVRVVDEYHWNTLSLDRVLDVVSPLASDVEVVSVPELVERKFGWAGYHNPRARTLVVTL